MSDTDEWIHDVTVFIVVSRYDVHSLSADLTKKQQSRRSSTRTRPTSFRGVYIWQWTSRRSAIHANTAANTYATVSLTALFIVRHLFALFGSGISNVHYVDTRNAMLNHWFCVYFICAKDICVTHVGRACMCNNTAFVYLLQTNTLGLYSAQHIFGQMKWEGHFTLFVARNYRPQCLMPWQTANHSNWIVLHEIGRFRTDARSSSELISLVFSHNQNSFSTRATKKRNDIRI